MTVVRNEFEMGENNPGGVLFKHLQNISFDWHANGHTAIGNRSDIEHVRIENLQNFYRTWYQPDNAVLLVTGKFDAATTLKWITSAFAAIPKPKRSLPEFWTVEPAQDGERSVTLRRKGDMQILALAYKIPAELHADAPAINVLSNILGDSASGRLHKQLVVPGKAAAAFAFTMNGATPGLQLLGAINPARLSVFIAGDVAKGLDAGAAH
jgi:zinc protease